jgi:hypothetical protein
MTTSCARNPREAAASIAQLGALACGREGIPPSAPLPSAAAAARPSALAAARQAAADLPAGAVLLDLRSDGTSLQGLPDFAIPEADPVPSLRGLVMAGGRERRWRFDGVSIREARFVPGGGGAVVLTLRGELLWLPALDAAPRALDARVSGPISVAAGGRYLAYVRGEPPELEVFRYDLLTGAAKPVTGDLAPAWCPAISADGQEVLFVSGASGAPALMRGRVGGAAARLTAADPPGHATTVPSGPRAVVDR